MTRSDIIDLLMLLSALESWSFAEKHRLPDYLLERLDDQIVKLKAEAVREPPSFDYQGLVETTR